MKITFEQLESTDINKNSNIYSGHLSSESVKGKKAYALNAVIFDKDNSEKSSYGFNSKNMKESISTLTEQLKNANNYDSKTAQKYMAVMSNIMSEKDYANLSKDGFNPAKIPVGEAVTSLDKIKVELEKAGTHIAGYTDDISREKVINITGSLTEANNLNDNNSDIEKVTEELKKSDGKISRSDIADALVKADLPVNEDNVSEIERALEQAHCIRPINDATYMYLTKNELEPTIENVYEAQSASGYSVPSSVGKYFESDGYMAVGAMTDDLSGIDEQIRSILENAGIELNEKTIQDAQWLITNGIPLTPKSIQLYEDLKSISFPVKDAYVLPEITDAMSNGLRATNAYLIRNYRLIKNERIAEEARLLMTSKANNALLESNLYIDTSGLEEKVEQLRQSEDNFYRAVFGKYEGGDDLFQKNVDLYKNAISTIEKIKQVPAQIIGRINSDSDTNLQDIYKDGTALKAKYDAAMTAYETLGTSVRKDLGDDIQKAFRNVDNILEEMGYEKTFDNQRAVRILGYNSMEINEENLEKVRALDIEVRGIIDKMTPATVLGIIQKNNNPLEMSINELSNVVDDMYDENDSIQNYARFLNKLERNKKITDEEATSYIGIYRLFNAIEKSDGMVIGGMINSKRDFTIKNLLEELRAKKRQGTFESKIYDELVEESDSSRHVEDFKIDVQIGAGFNYDYLKRASKEIYQKLDPEVLYEAHVTEDTSLYDLLDILRSGYNNNKELTHEDYKEIAKQLKEAANADEKIYQILEHFDIHITAENVNALESIFQNRLNSYAKFFDNANDRNKKNLREKIEKVHEKFDEEDSAKEAYEDYIDSANEIIKDVSVESGNIVDVKIMQNLHRQLTISKQLAQSENYEVPIFEDGRLTTINLKVLHGYDEGRVEVFMESESLGKVSAKFTVRNKKAEGVISTTNPDAMDKMENIKNYIDKEMSLSGMKVTNISVFEQKNLVERIYDDSLMGSKFYKPDSKDLYNTAKIFIKAFRREIS